MVFSTCPGRPAVQFCCRIRLEMWSFFLRCMMLHDTFWVYDYHRWPPGTTTKCFLKHRYSSRWFPKFAWNWKSLQNAFWDLHKMLYWAFFLHVGLAKTLDHFVENLYYPKCRPNKFSADHFVDPGYRRLLCTYKKGSSSTPPELQRGFKYIHPSFFLLAWVGCRCKVQPSVEWPTLAVHFSWSRPVWGLAEPLAAAQKLRGMNCRVSIFHTSLTFCVFLCCT